MLYIYQCFKILIQDYKQLFLTQKSVSLVHFKLTSKQLAHAQGSKQIKNWDYSCSDRH